MTEGEITFHLREILAHWTAPRITTNTADELERLGLIEFSEERRLVRLTPVGVQRKIASRSRTEDSTVSWVRQRQRGHGQRGQRNQRGQRRPKRKNQAGLPRPLV